jgi:hypothetical protein
MRYGECGEKRPGLGEGRRLLWDPIFGIEIAFP